MNIRIFGIDTEVSTLFILLDTIKMMVSSYSQLEIHSHTSSGAFSVLNFIFLFQVKSYPLETI